MYRNSVLLFLSLIEIYRKMELSSKHQDKERLISVVKLSNLLFEKMTTENIAVSKVVDKKLLQSYIFASAFDFLILFVLNRRERE